MGGVGEVKYRNTDFICFADFGCHSLPRQSGESTLNDTKGLPSAIEIQDHRLHGLKGLAQIICVADERENLIFKRLEAPPCEATEHCESWERSSGEIEYKDCLWK